MRQFLMMISLLFVHSMTMAENKISGVLVDNSDSSPLIGATVVLLDEASGSRVGTTTDASGKFELKEVRAGNYVLQCSYVGYDALTIVLMQLDKSTDLGVICMSASSALLDEVVVKGEKVVQKIDRQLVMPTEAQKKASTNGVSLLQNLQLPNLSVNALNKTITTNYGEAVQLRINGVEVTQAEVLAVRPEEVIRVEYHEQPGLRYGGAGAVIDYIIKKKETGGHLSADLTNGVSLLGFGDYHVSGKFHRGKSSFTGLMQWSRRDLEWNRENEETFHYPNNTIINKEVVASPNKVKYDYITTSLSYLYMNGEKSMLNIAFHNDSKDSELYRNVLLPALLESR